MAEITNKKDVDALVHDLEQKVLNLEKLNKTLTSRNIKLNAPIDEASKSTFLHKMIEDNKVLSTKWLLDNHANPYVENSYGLPAFFSITTSNKPNELFKLFVQYNIDFNFKSSHGRILLQDIVLNGDVNLFKKVVEHTKNPFSIDNYGKNILFDALSSGSKEMMQAVYSLKGADLNIQNKDKDSLLHFTKDGNLDLIEFLLQKGVSPALQDFDEKNIIFYLSERMESTTIVSEISKIAKLIDLAMQVKDAIDQKNQNGETLLLGFLKNLHKPLGEYQQKQLLSRLIATFIENGIDVNEPDNEGNNALHIAVEKNDVETVKILVESGANVNQKNGKGNIPLNIAVMNGSKEYFDMVRLLLALEADPNILDNSNMSLIEKIIYILIYSYNYENTGMPFALSDILGDEEEEDAILNMNKDDHMKNILELMISHKIADLSKLDSQGNPYFFILIITENDELARLLFRYGADVNQPNTKKQNILQYYLEFASQNKLDSNSINKRIKEIIKFGINLDYRDELGGSILHNTILHHPLDITKNIHKCGASMNAVDYKGRTLLHNAIWAENIEKIKYILNKDRKLLNTPDKLGVLPINYAAFMGSKELVCYLIKEKSYVNNTHDKPPFIINFLKRFHKNITKLEKLKSLTPEEKKDINILIQNMKKEFNIVE